MLNNPLRYTDPSGEINFLAAVAIGAAIFGTTNVAVQAANGEIDCYKPLLKKQKANGLTQTFCKFE